MLPVSPASARRRFAPARGGSAARFLNPHGRSTDPAATTHAADATSSRDARDAELAARLSVLLRGL